MKEFIFGTFIYEYKLIRQDRKTLSLTVTPDLQIILKCPEITENEKIETFLQKKWFWLEKQLSFFKKYKRQVYEREYVSGESYRYLGRQYKLLVKRSVTEKVALSSGIIHLHTTELVSNSKYNKKILTDWFLNQAVKVFEDRYEQMLLKFEYKNPPIVSVREMHKRWGSYLGKHKILLNPKLIHLPKECIDYVLVHELCHMKYRDHNKRFYDLLEKQFPRWRKVKEKLEIIGSMI